MSAVAVAGAVAVTDAVCADAVADAVCADAVVDAVFICSSRQTVAVAVTEVVAVGEAVVVAGSETVAVGEAVAVAVVHPYTFQQ